MFSFRVPFILEGCKHFVVDVAKEILVLYENVYEIYGDIRGAKNCFKFKAYAQGNVLQNFLHLYIVLGFGSHHC